MRSRFPSYFSYGRRSLAERFRRLLAAIQALRMNAGVDEVHDLRVASRRFHAAAVLFNDCADPRMLSECERGVRRIRKSAGAVRDDDVQCEFIQILAASTVHSPYRSGLERMILRLSQRREKKVNKILTAVEAWTQSRSIETMASQLRMRVRHSPASRPPLLRQRAREEIGLYVMRMLRYEQFVSQPEAAELHALRIAAKRLRYVMEIFNPLYRGRLKPFIHLVRSIQDSLGRMHDCVVWQESLPGFIEKERRRTARFFGETFSFRRIEKGALFFSRRVRLARNKQYLAFLKTWRRAERQHTWKTLTDISL